MLTRCFRERSLWVQRKRWRLTDAIFRDSWIKHELFHSFGKVLYPFEDAATFGCENTPLGWNRGPSLNTITLQSILWSICVRCTLHQRLFQVAVGGFCNNTIAIEQPPFLVYSITLMIFWQLNHSDNVRMFPGSHVENHSNHTMIEGNVRLKLS